MPINESWTYWLTNSIVRAFVNGLRVKQLPVFFNGEAKKMPLPSAFVDLLIEGPNYEDINSRTYQAVVGVTAILNVTQSDANFTAESVYVGQVLSVMSDRIEISSLGTRECDTDTFLTCLRLLDKPYDSLSVTSRGLIYQPTTIRQSVIRSYYSAEFIED